MLLYLHKRISSQHLDSYQNVERCTVHTRSNHYDQNFAGKGRQRAMASATISESSKIGIVTSGAQEITFYSDTIGMLR